MITMTATEVSRSFAHVLDEVQHGETVIVTRGGKRIATIGPTEAANGARVLNLLDAHRADEEYARDVRAARDAVRLDDPVWLDD